MEGEPKREPECPAQAPRTFHTCVELFWGPRLVCVVQGAGGGGETAFRAVQG